MYCTHSVHACRLSEPISVHSAQPGDEGETERKRERERNNIDIFDALARLIEVYQCFHFPIYLSTKFNLEAGLLESPPPPFPLGLGAIDVGHTLLQAPRERPNFRSIYATVVTPLIPNRPRCSPGSSVMHVVTDAEASPASSRLGC